jgi:hypothetical protein
VFVLANGLAVAPRTTQVRGLAALAIVDLFCHRLAAYPESSTGADPAQPSAMSGPAQR